MQSPHKRQFGSHRAAPPSSSDDSSDDELFMGADKSDSEPEEYGSRQPAKSYETHHRGGSRPTKAPRDKHAPAEVSSKKRPSFLQQVVAVPKEVRRDPRFEESSGSYNASSFRSVYKFVDHPSVKESRAEAAMSQWMATERQARAQGKKAYYLSKKDKKELALGERFKELQEKGGDAAVEKFMLKKRKRNATGDRKALPWGKPARK